MGNSAAVARRLSELLPPSFPDHVWVFPVHAWGIPPVLVRHISSLNLAGTTVHLVCTYGDETGNIDRQWRRLIESRGATVGGIYGVQMPNTYVCFPFMDVDSPAKAADKLAAAAPRIEHIARSIAAGSVTVNLHRGFAPWFTSGVIYPFFFRRQMKVAKFHFTDSCTACGLCAARCPQANITRTPDGRPLWSNDCTFCLRCYHVCPSHAVAYGRVTAKKGQYLHPDFQRNINLFEK